MTRQALFLVPLAALFAVATSAQAQQTVMFRTPSNNIHCMAMFDKGKSQPDDVVCDISKIASRPLLPKPADCEFDWGQRFVLEPRGGAFMGCYSDWVGSDTSPVLGYGRSLQIGSIVCESSQQGLECRNGAGRGFFLSRAKQSIF
jgi:hypothetical protein